MKINIKLRKRKLLDFGNIIQIIILLFALLFRQYRFILIFLIVYYFIATVVIGYNGLVRKNLDNKWVWFLGGTRPFGQGFGINTTPKSIRRGTIHNIITNVISIILMLLLLFYF